MKLLLLLFTIGFGWKIFWLCAGILFLLYLVRFVFCFHFFESYFERREVKKEEEAEAKWKKLLEEKDIYYFFPDLPDGSNLPIGNKHYNDYTQSQIKDLFEKSSGILEMLKVSNLRFPYYEASWEIEKEEMERRFDHFLNDLSNINQLNLKSDSILKIKKELRPETRNVTFLQTKKFMFKRLEAKIEERIWNHFISLKKDEEVITKEDWKIFFDLSSKFFDKDYPILLKIGREINKLSR